MCIARQRCKSLQLASSDFLGSVHWKRSGSISNECYVSNDYWMYLMKSATKAAFFYERKFHTEKCSLIFYRVIFNVKVKRDRFAP